MVNLLFALILPVFAVRAATVSCEERFANDHPLRLEVEKLEVQAQSHRVNLKKLEFEIEELEADLRDIHRSYGFLEEHLWRWLARLLGGDLAALDLANKLEGKHEKLIEELNDRRETFRKNDQAVVDAITQYLRENDDFFIALNREAIVFHRVLRTGQNLLDSLSHAIHHEDDGDVEAKLNEFVHQIDLLAQTSDFKELDAQGLLKSEKSFLELQAAVEEQHHRFEQSYHKLKREIDARVCSTRARCKP